MNSDLDLVGVSAALLGLCALLVVCAAIVGADAVLTLRQRAYALLPGLAALTVACVAAALTPPCGPVAQGLLVGGLAVCLMGLLPPAGVAAVAAAAATFVPLAAGEDALARASGLAVGSWIVAWGAGLPEPRPPGLTTGATLLTLGAVGGALGVARDVPGFLPALCPALVLVIGVAAAVHWPRDRARPAVVTATMVGLVLLAAGLASFANASPLAALTFALGLLAALMVTSIDVAAGGEREALLAGLLVAATGTVAFELDRGLGLVAAGIGAAAVPVLRGSRSEVAEADVGLVCCFTALSAWALFRLCYERVPLSASRLDLYLHTPLLGFLFGLLGPLFAVTAPGDGRLWGLLERAARTLVLLVAPAAVSVILWGQPTGAGALAATVVMPIVLLALSPWTRQERLDRLAVAATAYATSAALALVAIVAFAGLAREARTTKILLLMALVAVGAVYAGGRAYLLRPRGEQA